MMNYKITIYGSNMYQEVSLKPDFSEITIGTRKDDRIQFVREKFYADFEIRISRTKEVFTASADGGICFRTDKGIDEYVRRMTPGDHLAVLYSGMDSPFLFLDFSYDFSMVQDNYDLMITPTSTVFTIGGREQDTVFIPDETLEGCSVRVTSDEDGLNIETSGIRFGVGVNGFMTRTPEIKIRKHDFFSLGNVIFYYNDGKLYTSKNKNLRTDMITEEVRHSGNSLEYPKFVLSARQKYVMPDNKPEILPPDKKQDPPENNLVLTIIPMVAMLVLMVFFRGGGKGGGAGYIIYFAGMMIVGAVVSVVTYFKTKKQVAEKNAKREELYAEYLTDKENEIIELRDQEQMTSDLINTSLEEELQMINRFDMRLFEKRLTDEDFLNIRIGKGRMVSLCQPDVKKQEFFVTQDMLMNAPVELADKYREIDNMPVVIKLKEQNAVGFIGNRTKLYQMAKNIMIQIAAQHFYHEVKMVMVMSESDAKLFSWARWLQNMTEDGSGVRLFMYDQQSTKAELEFLYSILSDRESAKKESGSGGTLSFGTNFVVFVFRPEGIASHPLMNYVDKAAGLGFNFIFFEEYEERLHPACTERIFLSADRNEGYVQETSDGSKKQYFTYPHISQEIAAKAALKLAPIYVDEVSLASTLTKNITLFELYGIMSAYDLDLGKRWETSKIYDSMAAPLGVDAAGDVVALDIHEKYHGPHGLVAGTTGSGKSETLQSYLLSLAIMFHPYEVGIIIIDFKGGGMANQFRNLPHLNGAITNIDGKEINRSLMSIRAELLKRQRLFAKYDVNHIDDYIRLFKAGTADIPLPHLILVVDEFAELKSEQPDFMKELISTARIGRSLGVHLILATQKPSGVVNDQIWSNSKFKLCLKVQDKSDSNEVLHSPLAAEIKEPGRAYLQVGNNEIFKLFQSAYSGAPARFDSTDSRKKFEIDSIDLAGRRRVIYKQKTTGKAGSETQLDALVDYIHEYCEKNNIVKLPDICLPPLGTVIPCPKAEKDESVTDIIVPIGIYDDPSRQEQKEYSLNFTKSHVLLIGSSLSGKTNFVQTVIRGIAERYTPKDVNIYILDFASMILKNLSRLSHVGGVLTLSEDDTLHHLIQMVEKIIDDRKDKLSEMGLSSFSSYREAGFDDMPQVIVVIENYSVLRSTYPEEEEQISNLVREGVSNGVSFLVTNQQNNGIGYKILSNFGQLISLHCNDETEYSSLFGRCQIKPDNTPGRGVLKIDKEMMEFQTYLAFNAEKEIERIEEMRSFVKETNEKYAGMRAVRVPVVPEKVTDAYLEENFGTAKIENDRILAGINYRDAEPVWIDIRKNNILTVSGSEELGRKGFVTNLVRHIGESRETFNSKLYIYDDVSRELSFAEDMECTEHYSISAEDLAEMLNEINDELVERYSRIASDPGTDLAKEPLLVLIVNAAFAFKTISDDDDLADILDSIMSQYKDYGVSVLFTNVPEEEPSFRAPKPIRMLVDLKRHIAFRNAAEMQFIALSSSLVRSVKKPNGPGDAFFVDGTAIRRIKSQID